MKVHVLQHVPFEDIGSMALWLNARRAEVSYTRFYENAVLPEINDLDLIVAMGGPMSVNDESEFPWLRAEKKFLRDAIARGISVLGVCLGSQLIASALGSRVYRNSEKEIGWFPIEGTNPGTLAFQFPKRLNVFHWHGETFDLPKGAIHLARNNVCENQAFQIGRNVIGLQFHLEITPASVSAMVEHGSHECISAPYIQLPSQLLAVPDSTYLETNGVMNQILSYAVRPSTSM